MREQHFLTRHQAHPRQWRPGEDPTPWFTPVSDMLEQQNKDIERARVYGFTYVSYSDDLDLPPNTVHCPNAHTIQKLEQEFDFHIDFDGVFYYALHTKVTFDESL